MTAAKKVTPTRQFVLGILSSTWKLLVSKHLRRDVLQKITDPLRNLVLANGLRGDRSFALLTPGLFSVDVLEADFGTPASEYALDVTSG
jgi:hypothetical protein